MFDAAWAVTSLGLVEFVRQKAPEVLQCGHLDCPGGGLETYDGRRVQQVSDRKSPPEQGKPRLMPVGLAFLPSGPSLKPGCR